MLKCLRTKDLTSFNEMVEAEIESGNKIINIQVVPYGDCHIFYAWTIPNKVIVDYVNDEINVGGT